MDNLTHTLFAVTLARSPLGRAGRGTTVALVVGSNIPDVDIAAAARGAVSYVEWHRGPTHGPLGIIGLGVLTAALVWSGRRAFDRRWTPDPDAAGNASFRMLVAISIIAAAGHVLMDLPTSYGTRLLSPFDWHWFAFDWLPIVDVYLWMVLGVGLAFAAFATSSRRRVAAIALALMAANYGLRAVSHRQALALAPRLFGSILPQPCDPQVRRPFVDYWPRARATTTASGRPCLVEIAALPTFASPFRWRIVAQLSNAYELHDVDLLDARFRQPVQEGEVFWRRATRYPNQWGPATATAAATPTGRVFLGFSRFPAARAFVDPAGIATVRWSDMRFVAGMAPADTPPGRYLFNVLIRVGPDGGILEERLGR